MGFGKTLRERYTERKQLNVAESRKEVNFLDTNGDISILSTDDNISYSDTTQEITLVEYSGAGQNKGSIDLRHVALTIGVSLLAFPITYVLNEAFIKIQESERALWMSILGFALMTFVFLLVLLISKVQDWLFYGFSLFAFTAAIDLIISLEYNGIISGYMSQYLKLGEPYLQSCWGNAICLFDATGFYLLYLIMNFQLANRKSWRSTAIYWGSGLLNSMIVFGIGVFCGSHNATACTFLNIPYILFPVLVLIRAFQRQKPTAWVETVDRTILSFLYEVMCLAVLLTSLWITLSKGLVSLRSEKDPFLWTVKDEKALDYNEPGPFAAVQALTFFFYLIPLQLISLYYHFKTTKPRFLWDLTVIQAGAVMQGQFSYLAYSFDPQLPEENRVLIKNQEFWFSNLILLITPHLLLLGLLRYKWGTPRSAIERVLRKSM